MHPSPLAEGFEIAKHEAQYFLQQFKKDMQKKIKMDKETLVNVAKTALRTKLGQEIADNLSTIVVDAIECITIKDQPLDLHMVEIQSMEHRLDTDTKLVKGLVLDHGPRHPDMKTKLKNCYILTCNVTLEYEKSEVNSQFMITDPDKRQEIIEAERKTVDDKVKQIIALKEKVCPKPSAKSTLDNVILPEERNFVVVNQKGIDPLSLDMLAKAGITALRRAKRRNMERLTLACGGVALNSFDDMNEKCLGYATDVHEEILGEEKYTFIEGVTNPHSCTILIKAPNRFSIQQIKDSIRDGLRAVKNAQEDNCLLPGGGAFEVALYDHLMKFSDSVKGKTQIGVKCFAESLLIIPKTLATNSGLDALDSTLKLQQEYKKGNLVGLDLISGDCLDPIASGIFDNFKVKEQILESATFTASQLLYVDEILSAGKSQQKISQGNEMQ